MSGHSKWKNIMHKKEKTDLQRAKIFTKIGKEIAIAVRDGGADPASNDKLKDLIRRKIDKLDKFFEDETVVKVVLKESKDIETMEVTVGVNGSFIRGEVTGESMYDNIDLVLPKIEKQIIKHHSKNLWMTRCVIFL